MRHLQKACAPKGSGSRSRPRDPRKGKYAFGAGAPVQELQSQASVSLRKGISARTAGLAVHEQILGKGQTAMTLENSESSLRQCRDCQQWFERNLFPPKSARCKACLLARARELSRTPEQVQKRKERRANRTPEQRETIRETGRRDYANRTPEQEQRGYERRQARKDVDNARARELRAQSPERRERQRASVRKSTLKSAYGITPAMRQFMYDKQDGKCCLCDVKPGRRRRGLVIDHDKDRGFVRGLLCHTCNSNFIDEYSKLPDECRDFPASQ